jgi:hypothetical protein
MKASSEKKDSLRLLDQIIEAATEEDRIHKAEAISRSKASQSIGESWMCFHLKRLKELLEKGE